MVKDRRAEEDRREVDQTAGSGSSSFAADDTDAMLPDESRSVGDTGATTFDPADASSQKEEHYRNLRKRHHGHFSTNPKEINNTGVAYDVRTVCNRLEVTDHQQSRIEDLVEIHRQQGEKYEATILGVTVYILNLDGRWIERGGEHGDELYDEYEDIRQSFGVSPSARKRVTQRVRQYDKANPMD